MKLFFYIPITCIIFLYGCQKQKLMINPMLLRGAEGHLWCLYDSGSENPQYLWFDQYGQCQVLEYEIANEPTLVIPNENLLSNMDSCLEIPVLLNGLPYRMIQIDEDIIYPDDMEEGESIVIPFASDEEYFRYVELHKKYKILTRTFIPDQENVEWYQILTAQYYPRGKKMWWSLTKSFIPLDSHPLNGHWESHSDSIILLNGQTYQMFEKTIRIKDKWMIDVALNSDRKLILHNTETGDSICLLDTDFPPSSYIDRYWERNETERVRYERFKKKWRKSIRSSVLLNGEKSRLYHCVVPDDTPSLHNFVYVDDNGIFIGYSLVEDLSYISSDNYYRYRDSNIPAFWRQKGNTIIWGLDSHYKETILNVSACRDTIKIFDEYYNRVVLYIDTKLPPSGYKRWDLSRWSTSTAR